MRLTISSLVCFTLFVLTKGAPPPDKRCCDPIASPACANPCQPSAPLQFAAPAAPTFGAECCAPGPACANPCDAGPPPQQFFVNFANQPAPPPPPPPPIYTGDSCCAPSPDCANPCAQAPPMAPPMFPPMLPPMPPPMPPPMAPPMGAPMDPCCDPYMEQSCANPCAPPAAPPAAPPVAYAPNPGEITFKLRQPWDPDKYLDEQTAPYKILSGNVVNAIQAGLGRDAQVSNIYFREGYVPGNPSTMPIVVAHVMVDGGSDASSLIQRATSPDGKLGDGLLVYKDSFNAY